MIVIIEIWVDELLVLLSNLFLSSHRHIVEVFLPSYTKSIFCILSFLLAVQEILITVFVGKLFIADITSSFIVCITAFISWILNVFKVVGWSVTWWVLVRLLHWSSMTFILCILKGTKHHSIVIYLFILAFFTFCSVLGLLQSIGLFLRFWREFRATFNIFRLSQYLVAVPRKTGIIALCVHQNSWLFWLLIWCRRFNLQCISRDSWVPVCINNPDISLFLSFLWDILLNKQLEIVICIWNFNGVLFRGLFYLLYESLRNIAVYYLFDRGGRFYLVGGVVGIDNRKQLDVRVICLHSILLVGKLQQDHVFVAILLIQRFAF